jgi:hypothetical protein
MVTKPLKSRFKVYSLGVQSNVIYSVRFLYLAIVTNMTKHQHLLYFQKVRKQGRFIA